MHTWYRQWRIDGTWDRMHDAMVRQVRLHEGRDANPKTASIDSQSVKTTEMGGPRGFDSGKKVKGRKRHIWVDSLGLLLSVIVMAANVTDAAAGCDLVGSVLWTDLPRLQRIYADSAYRAGYFQEMIDETPFELVVVRRDAQQPGWQTLPKRWVAERTFAWLGRARRLSKDYERTPASSEAMIKICMIQHMLDRLEPSDRTRGQHYNYAA